MRIGANCQAIAPLQAAALEHLAAIGSGHALTETVNTHAPTNTGLIRTFRCHVSSLENKNFEYQTALFCRGFQSEAQL
jgi:hypothetical protein